MHCFLYLSFFITKHSHDQATGSHVRVWQQVMQNGPQSLYEVLEQKVYWFCATSVKPASQQHVPSILTQCEWLLESYLDKAEVQCLDILAQTFCGVQFHCYTFLGLSDAVVVCDG